MPTYLHPGVYLEELRGGAQPIQGVGTSTAAFVGFARQGPIGSAEFISQWTEYEAVYGGIFPGDEPDLMGLSVNAFFSNGGASAYIVRLADGADRATGLLLDPTATDAASPAATDRVYAFSAQSPGNWGNAVRVTLAGWPTPTTLTVQLMRAPAPNLEPVPVITESYRSISLDPGAPRFIGTLLAASSLITAAAGPAGDYMYGDSTGGVVPTSTDLTTLNGKGLTVTVNGVGRQVTFGATEFVAGTTLPQVAAAIQHQVVTGAATPAVGQFTATARSGQLVLRSGGANAASAVVVTAPTDATPDATAILHLGTAAGGTERTGEQVLKATLVPEPGAGETTVQFDLTSGADGQPGSEGDFQNVFAEFLKLRDINIICLPGTTWDGGSGTAVISDAIAHAETSRSRMVVVDPPLGAGLETATAVEALNLSTSTYAALYYPWLEVSNPDYNGETNPTVPPTVAVPPSGFAAGMWSKIDARRGVWKAPAGTETGLLGPVGLEVIVEDAEQDALNPLGVNCIRRFPVYGQVIWGARTLATNADPEWRYIPVRRTAMFIEGSVYNGIQWAVFEPNDDQLWAALRASIGSFMDGLFRQGAFQGATASDAYFVRCGLGSTMTQGDIDSGQVIAVVGFAPLKPAEFVIVRIQQQVGQ